jgi:hypothetical protein
MLRNFATLVWLFIKQPGLALMLWRARHDLPRLLAMRRALEPVDEQSSTREI